MKNFVLSLVACVSFSAFAPAALAQDAKAGEKKAAMCIGCHGIPGYQASFPEIHKVPMISGQGAEYIVSALQAYKKGDRKHPTMRSIAGSLSDQDMADLGAFYQQSGKDLPPTNKAAAEPSAQVKALLDKAKCASCHGENLNKPVSPAYPKLAGQHADYLYVALKAYQGNKAPQVGRANPIMGGMAAQYTPAELKQLADYISTLPGDLHVVPQSRFR